MNQFLGPVKYPQDMNAAFAEAYNSRDLERALALYEPHSIHVHPNGTPEQGALTFRNALYEFFKLEGTLVSTNIYCIPFEDLALLRAHYILDTAAAIHMEGHTTEVVRRQPDGTWKYIIDHPFGANPLDRLVSSR